MDQDFHRMTLHETRSQISPQVARKPQAAVYRAGPAPYRGYHDNKDEFLPPPPPPTSYHEQHNFPPPPPETKENIYHEIQDEDFPPPPPGAPEPAHARPGVTGYSQYSTGPGMSYEARQETQTMSQPTGRYEVKQATYSVQSTDSSGRSSPRSSPYTSQYGTMSSMPQQNTYNTSPNPMSQTYSTSTYGQPQTYNTAPSYGPYSSTNVAGSPSRYSPSPAAPSEDSGGVTYAQIADTGVTYAQIVPRADRAVPGPQMPIQIKVQDPNPQSAYLAPQQSQYQRHSPSQATYGQAQPTTRPSPDFQTNTNSKEQEVDALTQMLMQGLEGSKDPDFFGICAKCGMKVVGEANGCTAMDNVFHIACFACVSCGTLLRGKSFYAMETKPHCEPCYLNTLEKCSICSKPITDRLLRATGKPYHPACFTCVVCGVSLDGIPFTVDATNQIHCIEDFHRKFAPRCCVCQKPIMPQQGQESTVRVVAMDKSFHIECYRCEDCGDLLSSEAEGRGCYPLDEHILCKACNAKRINALTTKLSTEL